MKRSELATCVACASIVAAAFTGSAVAADLSTYTFYDCVTGRQGRLPVSRP